MVEDNFFITLLSNSSTTYHPNNKTTSFTVTLPQKISLPGKWYVGVAEIHYNYNFFNISEGNNQIKFTFTTDDNDMHEHENMVKRQINTHCEIEPGFYTDMNDVIRAINDEIKSTNRFNFDVFSMNKMNGRCKVHILDNLLRRNIENIHLQGRLSTQLGFEPNTNINEYSISPHCCNLQLGIPDQMLIYTDIIEPSFIGHEKAYVIKIVNTQPKNLKFGDACYMEFEQIHYIPVQKREFDNISVDIRDHSGKFMPFEYGVFTIKLHFKKYDG